MILSGVTGVNSSIVNGVYLFKGMKDDKPFYKNLVSQSFLFCASDNKWCVSSKEDCDAGKAAGWCRSVESGLDHPLRAHPWEVLGSGDFEEQSAVKIVVTVIM